jgi:hypothetical protein
MSNDIILCMINLNESPNISDHLIGYVTDGFMPLDVAVAIVSTDPLTRATYAEQLEGLSADGLPEGQEKRAEWLARQLGKDLIDDTIFTKTAAQKPELGPKHGLMYIADTGGRHSGPNLNSVAPSTN